MSTQATEQPEKEALLSQIGDELQGISNEDAEMLRQLIRALFPHRFQEEAGA